MPPQIGLSLRLPPLPLASDGPGVALGGPARGALVDGPIFRRRRPGVDRSELWGPRRADPLLVPRLRGFGGRPLCICCWSSRWLILRLVDCHLGGRCLSGFLGVFRLRVYCRLGLWRRDSVRHNIARPSRTIPVLYLLDLGVQLPLLRILSQYNPDGVVHELERLGSLFHSLETASFRSSSCQK